MNKRIRNGLISTAVVASSFVGAGVVNAQSDDTAPAEEPTVEPTEEPTVEPTERPTDVEPTETERQERRAERAESRAEKAQEIADLLGTDIDELQTAFQDGQTMAQVAEANGVDVQVVIDSIVESKTERIGQAVAADRLTDAEAADKIAQLEERVTMRVNEGRGERGDRMSRGEFHRSGRGGEASAVEPES